jgi:hypothetical protein
MTSTLIREPAHAEAPESGPVKQWLSKTEPTLAIELLGQRTAVRLCPTANELLFAIFNITRASSTTLLLIATLRFPTTIPMWHSSPKRLSCRRRRRCRRPRTCSCLPTTPLALKIDLHNLRCLSAIGHSGAMSISTMPKIPLQHLVV